MKILYLSESMRWSGGAEQCLMMAGALRDRGHDLLMGCQPGSDLMQRSEAAGIPVASVRMRQDYDLLAVRDVFRLLKKQASDVLHAQHSTAHAIGLMAAAFDRRPAFAVTRRVMFSLKNHIFSRLKYRSRRIDGYVAVSDSVKGELVRGGLNPARIQVIPSVMKKWASDRDDGLKLRQELGLSVINPLIGTIANYASFKGQDYLVRAAATVLERFPKAQFLLVGRDMEQLTPLVERLGVAHAVKLSGFRQDIGRILAALDYFVLPSLQEAAGTALREAMATGLPAIGTRVGGIPESIVDEETGLLVPPADTQLLATAIMRYLEQPQWAKLVGEKGRQWVIDRFSLDRAAEQMEAFYDRLIRGRSIR